MSRFRIPTVALIIAATVALLGAPQASASTGDAVTAPVRRAHLRAVVLTTSDWVRVTLPGVSAGHHVVNEPASRELAPTRHGFTVRGVAGSFGAIGIDVVSEIPVDATEVRLTVQQGAAGTTAAWVQQVSDTGASPTRLPVVSSERAATVTVPVADLFGSDDLELARAVADPAHRQVLAFTYPWFSEAAVTDTELSVHPIDPLLADRAPSALAAAQLARANGVDGFVMSFAGGRENGLDLYQALQAARATNGTASVLIEARRAGSAAAVEQWVREALRQADDEAFLHYDGVPVVFVWGAFTLEPTVLGDLAAELATEGTPVDFVTDAHISKRPGIAGGYRYDVLQGFQPADLESGLVRANLDSELFARAGATLRGEQPTLHIATVEPGFDDEPLRGDLHPVIERNGTSTYDATWKAALATQPDWVVVTSWNEWYEGTSIAPSLEYGDDALAATARWSAQLHRAG